MGALGWLLNLGFAGGGAAVDRYWAGVGTDWQDNANWAENDGGAPPASYPVTGTNAYFTSNGNGSNCIPTAHVACANLTVEAGYTADIDLATYNLTMDSGKSVTLDGAGTFDNGTGSHSMSGSGWTFDNKDQNAFIRSTSTWTFNGTGTWITGNDNYFANFTTAAGSSVTMSTLTNARGGFALTGTFNGELILDKEMTIASTGDMIVNSGATWGGAQKVRFYFPAAAHGLLTLNAAASMPWTTIFSGDPAAVFVPGTWDGLLQIDSVGTICEWTPTAGTYTLNGGLEVRSRGAGGTTVHNLTNAPTYSVTDLTITLDSTGDVLIDDTAAAVNWTITGDVIDAVTPGGGTYTYTPGTGTITASGGGAQNWDWAGQDIEDVVVNSSGGTLTVASELACDSFTGTAGTMDLNAQTLDSAGDVTWASGFILSGLTGSAIEVGGNFTADGQDLSTGVTNTWTLSVVGTAAANTSGSVQYSDASGGTAITALAWTDMGNNTNWVFAPVDGPYSVDATQAYQAGAAEAEVYIAGAVEAEVKR